jgi:sorbitol-specific phosphotransferase system component IIBC
MKETEEPVKEKVRAMLDSIMEVTEAETIVLLVKNKDGRHRFGTNDIESVQLVLSAASHMSGQLAEFISNIDDINVHEVDMDMKSDKPQSNQH